jgi:tetratricopeptide (TPR) repeat protein
MMKKILGILCFLWAVTTATSAFSAASSDQYLAAGNTLYDQKNYDKAILYYKAAIQVDPNNAAAHTRLANTYYMLGKKQDALTQYQAALSLNPNNAQLSAFVQKLQAQLNGGGAPAMASASSAVPAEQGFLIGFGAGVDLPQTQGVTTMPFGVEVLPTYAFDKNLSIRGDIQVFFSTPITGISETDIRILPEVKYTFDGKGFQPYLVGGIGFDMVGLSDTAGDSASLSGLDFTIGAGAQFDLGNKLKLFGELKYNSASISAGSSSSSSGGSSGSGSSSSTSVSDIPFTFGLLLGL